MFWQRTAGALMKQAVTVAAHNSALPRRKHAQPCVSDDNEAIRRTASLFSRPKCICSLRLQGQIYQLRHPGRLHQLMRNARDQQSNI